MSSRAPDSRTPIERRLRWNGPPRQVLVLDDDELIVRTVSRTLRGAGLIVEGTTVVEEALERAAHDPPHVMVSDLHMPGACGADILTKMVTIAPGTMRVLLSADPELTPDVGKLLDARLHAVMSKLDMSALADVVLAQIIARSAPPLAVDEREALAESVARAAARPAHEDDGHRRRVARATARIATDLGCSALEVAAARLGAILHDVGQIAVRDVVFSRSRTLEDAERDHIATHTESGARIVAEMPALLDAIPIITMHHERQDGTGYPARLGGPALPRAVLAFQVADAYDAMTAGRGHAPARSHAEAITELRAEAGRHHHHDAVSALAAIDEDTLRALVAD